MFQTLRNAWKIVDLRKKILYTLLIVLIFRIGSAITVPFVDVAALSTAVGNISSQGSNFMDYLTMISGGGFADASVFALSILDEAALSFLGLGIRPPDASLGSMLSDSQTYLKSAPWYALCTGGAIVVLILGFSLLSEGLQQSSRRE